MCKQFFDRFKKMVCYHFVLSLRWKSLDHENMDVKNLVEVEDTREKRYHQKYGKY